MKMPHALGALLLAIAFAGCGSSETTALDASGGTKMFGVACMANSDCQSNYCGLFDQAGMLCTIMCTPDASTCPVGSQGSKCNMKGMCRP